MNIKEQEERVFHVTKFIVKNFNNHLHINLFITARKKTCNCFTIS